MRKATHDVSGSFLCLLALLFLSGAAALGAEVVWARVLHRILGSTALSVSFVVSGFLGGLGLGAWMGQKLLPRLRDPLEAYAGTEFVAVGATVLFPFLAEAASGILVLPGGEIGILVLVALAATPWGAAFPFVVAAISGGERLERRVREVYGWNALGSALGATIAGLVAVPGLGETGTLLACAGLEAVAGLGAVLLSRAEKHGLSFLGGALAAERSALPRLLPSEGGGGPGHGLAPAAYVFLAGAAVIYWEVLWTRILVLVVGATVYSFSVVAGAVVLGMGAGSLILGGRWLSRHSVWFLPCFTAACLLGGYFLVPALPSLYLLGVRASSASPLAAGCLCAAAVSFLPNFLLGSLFPCVVAHRARRAGSLYAWSSLGSVAGALLGGPVSSLAGSLETSYEAGVAGLFLLGLLGAFQAGALLRGEEGPEPSGPALSRQLRSAVPIGAAALLVTGVLLGAAKGWEPRRLLSGVYQWSPADLQALSLEDACKAREILTLQPGKEVIVTVELDRVANTVYVRGNGKVEGSVPADAGLPSLADLPTQVLLGLLPCLWTSRSPEPSALLVGLGSGVTLGALVEGEGRHGFKASRVDVVELEEAFLRAVKAEQARKYLRPFVPDLVLEAESEGSGGGVRYRFGDARRVLSVELRGGRWDAIVSQPSEPWISGASPLFTLEFFELVARRLKPGGMFFQWLQLYKLDQESVRLLVRTFRRVFTDVFVIRPPGTGEIILVGALEKLDPSRLLGSRLDARAAAAGLESPEDFLAVFLAGTRGVDRWVGTSPGLPVNTDGRSPLLYLAPLRLHDPRDMARENLSALREVAGGDPVTGYLPRPLRSDPGLGRRLAERNIRLGDFAEAWKILEGDDSAEAGRLRAVLREARAAEEPL